MNGFGVRYFCTRSSIKRPGSKSSATEAMRSVCVNSVNVYISFLLGTHHLGPIDPSDGALRIRSTAPWGMGQVSCGHVKSIAGLPSTGGNIKGFSPRDLGWPDSGVGG